MKKFIITALVLSCFAFNIRIEAQDLNQDIKYRRSSLSMILIESEDFPNKEAVMDSWGKFPFPDKYNEHEIELKSFDIDDIELTVQDFLDAGFLQDTLDNPLQLVKAVSSMKPLRYLNSENTVAVVLPTDKEEYQLKIDKVMRKNDLAKKILASWFNRSPEGKFDMSLIQERGFYNATEMEASIAEGQTRGLASLGDAGEELIRNTFVTFTKLNFVSNEPIAAEVRDAAKESILESMKGKPEMLINTALSGADKVYEKTKEGYSLWSKTWLYRLNWNDSIAAVFYNDLWSNPTAFNESKLFSLEFVGVQYNQSLVTFKIGEERTEEQIIDLALVRNIDNSFAELQKDHDVFKPKVPVLTSDPITAKIGMKEGLTGGEKFDVLEMVFDQKTGKTEYKKVGTIQADKKVIWDNRYNLGEQTTDNDGDAITATPFKGSKSIQPGMLLIQVK